MLNINTGKEANINSKVIYKRLPTEFIYPDKWVKIKCPICFSIFVRRKSDKTKYCSKKCYHKSKLLRNIRENNSVIVSNQLSNISYNRDIEYKRLCNEVNTKHAAVIAKYGMVKARCIISGESIPMPCPQFNTCKHWEGCPTNPKDD